MSDYLSFFLLRSRGISARDSPAKSLRFWLFLFKIRRRLETLPFTDPIDDSP